MQPIAKFTKQDRRFWAHIRLLSETLGYSSKKSFRSYNIAECALCLMGRGLSCEQIYLNGKATTYGQLIVDYLNKRSDMLKTTQSLFMNREEAKVEFEKIHPQKKLWTCTLPMNKQKGEKRHYSYLTCLVNMLTEIHLDGKPFQSNPRGLISFTNGKVPLRTFSRWMDGAYPDINDPVAIWEIKEYYGTTTFGSRVADGVYETMLDGEECAELGDHEKRHVAHYLIADDYFTWWDCGKSYLCRMVDMMHMGLVDEVLFGREVLTRWPQIVQSWPTK